SARDLIPTSMRRSLEAGWRPSAFAFTAEHCADGHHVRIARQHRQTLPGEPLRRCSAKRAASSSSPAAGCGYGVDRLGRPGLGEGDAVLAAGVDVVEGDCGGEVDIVFRDGVV